MSTSKILILDDDKNMTKLLDVVLKQDFKISIVHTLTQALSAITEETFDGVILDLNLDNESGFDLIQKIRQEKSEWFPIFVLSGKEKSEDRIACFEAGVDDYLVKPFNPVELKLRLQRTIKKYHQLQ